VTLGIRAFWAVVAALLLASAVLGSQVEPRRARGAARAAEAAPAEVAAP
jgi:hypothetical protein